MTGRRFKNWNQTQFRFLLVELEYIFYIPVQVIPEPEFQVLLPFWAKPEREIGFHREYGRNLTEFIFPKIYFNMKWFNKYAF